MKVAIENEHFKAVFDTKGAELQRVIGVDSQASFLWNGNPTYWGKFSPVLFPIIGALKNNQYEYEGQIYSLPRHGFARDLEFSVNQVNEHEILFTTNHNEETLKVYPFEFTLGLRYQIFKASLRCTYEVYNPSGKELLFSVGAHPAFAAPLNNQGAYTDYYLEFNNDEELTCHHILDNLISNTTSKIKLTDGKLFLKHELFYNDALVIKDLKSDCISLKNTKNYNGLDFRFKDFPYFGIWAAKDADFICLEPWYGIADSTNHNQQLKDKEGIIKLAANQNWERSWQVTFF